MNREFGKLSYKTRLKVHLCRIIWQLPVIPSGIVNCFQYITKRSLGQGNVFTRVYHSVHRGGGRVSAWRQLFVWPPGLMFLPGELWSYVPSGSGETLSRGQSPLGQRHPQTLPLPPRTETPSLYGKEWVVHIPFLFLKVFLWEKRDRPNKSRKMDLKGSFILHRKRRRFYWLHRESSLMFALSTNEDQRKKFAFSACKWTLMRHATDFVWQLKWVIVRSWKRSSIIYFKLMSWAKYSKLPRRSFLLFLASSVFILTVRVPSHFIGY